ncbi:demethylepipodophyllotoxin synthase-like [Macadamia integrifolia]|uniref:demethylepipodophyllotoxin synthase-like n=1 Tax=Macadamia integrifolia TaxID=60698 RepID=UPI001C4F71C4|nr:demethylepipodophyllotoxin synthase-like [Macadamia integrifolia]
MALYGPYWREVCKWVVHELLFTRRLESLKHVRVAEINNCIKDLYGLWVRNNRNQIKFEMNQLFQDLTMNIVLKMVVGKRYFSVVHGENNEEVCLSSIRCTSQLPIMVGLGWATKGNEEDCKEMEMLTKSWLLEHRQKRVTRKTIESDEQDFIDLMLSILEEDVYLRGHDRDLVVKAIAPNLILAAMDSTAITLSWVLSLLLNHREVLTKVQDELDFHVGKDRNVEQKDNDNLVMSSRKGKWTASSSRSGHASHRKRRGIDDSSSSHYARVKRDVPEDMEGYDDSTFYNLEAALAWSTFSKRPILMEKIAVVGDFT